MALSKPGDWIEDVTKDPNSKYYIGPIDTHNVSGGDLRQDASQYADVVTTALKPFFGDQIASFLQDPLTEANYEQRLKDERDAAEKGVTTRDVGTPPSTVWDNATHKQMVEAISNDADSASVANTSEEWVSLGNELTQHQQNLADAINDSVGNWSGDGGDAAREHLANVGKWLGTTAQGTALTGRQQEIHSQTLNETQRQMAANPPVDFDVTAANAKLQTITDPVAYAQQASADQATLSKQEGARQQAARTMSQYDSTIGSASAVPVFNPPPKLPGSTSTTSAQSYGSGAVQGAPTNQGTSGQAAGLNMVGADAAKGNVDGISSITSQGANGAPGQGGAGVNVPAASTGGGLPGGVGGGSAGGSGPAYGGGNIPGGAGGSQLNPGSITGGGSGGGNIPDIGSTDPQSTITSTGGSGSGSGGIGNIPGLGGTGGNGGDTYRTGGNTPLGNIPELGGSGGGSYNPNTGTIKGNIPELGGKGTGGSIPKGTSFKPGSLNDPEYTGKGLKGTGGLGEEGFGSGKGSGGGSLKGLGGGGLGEEGAGGKGIGTSAGSGSKLGAGPGSGAGAAAEEGAGRPGGAGAARPGASGSSIPHGAGGRGGKAEGDDDKEHKAADYLDGDPELFQGLGTVTPPVIGDWSKKKEPKKK